MHFYREQNTLVDSLSKEDLYIKAEELLLVEFKDGVDSLSKEGLHLKVGELLLVEFKDGVYFPSFRGWHTQGRSTIIYSLRVQHVTCGN